MGTPGTWPVDTLSYSYPQGFDSVVVHYASSPPTCTDYGVIFLADNMRVTALPVTGITDQAMYIDRLIVPNPVTGPTTISFSLLKTENINVVVYDSKGRLVKDLFNGVVSKGEHQLNWDENSDAVESGVYFLNVRGANFSRTSKLVVVK